MSMIIEALQFEFIQRALIAGVMIAVSCALLGGFLVLRGFSMIGDGLAHVSFATVAVGLLAGVAPLTLSVPLVMVASLLVLKLSKNGSMEGDAAIGLLSSFAVAMGVMISSVAGGFNVDLFSYLFGSILAIESREVVLSIILSIGVIVAVVFLYHDLFALTFDEEFALSSGLKTERFNKVLVLLTAVTVVLGVRVVGTMLISSLIVIPAVTALQLRTGFRMMLLFSVLFSVFSVIMGIFISYIFDLPTGATIVTVNFSLFVTFYILRLIKVKFSV